MTVKDSVDVAIVGGGPGGLSAANAVLAVRPDLKVRVYERSTKFHKRGNLFYLHPSAQSALEAISPAALKKARDHAAKLTSARVSDFETTRERGTFQQMVNDALGVDGGESLYMAWYKFRDALASVLPAECVEFGHILENVVLHDSGGARLIFSGSDEVVEAKVVIGCDGNMSRVRRCILNDGDPETLGTVMARGLLDVPEGWPNPLDVLYIYRIKDPSMYWIIGCISLEDRLLGWQCEMQMPEALKQNHIEKDFEGKVTLMAKETKTKFLESIKTLPDFICGMVADTPPELSTIHLSTYRDPEDIKVWGKGCVTLLGDAAHMGTPILSLGATCAIEDAVELGRAIGQLGPTEAALRRYEVVRIPRVAPAHAASVALAKGELKIGDLEWHLENPWFYSKKFEPLVLAVREQVGGH